MSLYCVTLTNVGVKQSCMIGEWDNPENTQKYHKIFVFQTLSETNFSITFQGKNIFGGLPPIKRLNSM